MSIPSKIPLDVAKQALEDIVNSNEYTAIYDLYDAGFTSSDAVQDALENYRRLLDQVIDRLISYRV